MKRKILKTFTYMEKCNRHRSPSSSLGQEDQIEEQSKSFSIKSSSFPFSILYWQTSHIEFGYKKILQCKREQVLIFLRFFKKSTGWEWIIAHPRVILSQDLKKCIMQFCPKCEEFSPFLLDTSNVDIQAHSSFCHFQVLFAFLAVLFVFSFFALSIVQCALCLNNHNGH